MTSELVAHFEKQFVGGSAFDINFRQSTAGFSVTALIGPSGCGKTTMLRCIAGLTNPDQGSITFCGETWFDAAKRVSLAPQQRDVGFLFQDYALFPHLNVAENIGYGLRQLTRMVRSERVTKIMQRFDLKGLDKRFPHQLSGGQQQRVALARALARRPRLLLLDEPLSALDAILRDQLRSEMRQLLSEFRIPVIFVTHDRMEAMSLSDHVAVMDEGRIQQIGSVQDVFNRPANASLARLVGVETVVAGDIVAIQDGLAVVRVGHVQLIAVPPTLQTQRVYACIRGEDVALRKGSAGATSVRNHLEATVESLTFEGPLVRVGLNCGFALTSLITRPAHDELQLRVGDHVVAMLKAPAIHLIPRMA